MPAGYKTCLRFRESICPDLARPVRGKTQFCKPKVGGSIPSSGTKSPSAIVRAARRLCRAAYGIGPS
jgi:hypothetical protein